LSHRVHLFSLRISHAMRECFTNNLFSRSNVTKDLLAGISVGIIAIPLAMALAIASGVPPQYGLYTAAVAGILVPLVGGSRFSVSGPTAAFVVIIQPIVHQYGLAGLLVTTVFSGILLILMGFLRLGRYIEYVPQAVTLGFTGGIAVVIAILQVDELLGIEITEFPTHFYEKVGVLLAEIPAFDMTSLFIGALTLSVLIIWPYFIKSMPPHLPALVVGGLFAIALASFHLPVATIGSTYQFLFPDGSIGHGIPPFIPNFELPWLRHLPEDPILVWNLSLFSDLLAASFAIAALGAIESLLCAVVLDDMSQTRHSANSELLGQGIGNIVAPFLGGITATGAIARSATNCKSGAKTPLSAVFHGVFIFLAILYAAPLLSYIPMPSMAALLLIVAWKMGEFHKSLNLIKTASKSDITVFLTCFSLTVLFDMVVAIIAGIMLASLLFVRKMSELTELKNSTDKHFPVQPANKCFKVFDINGPLFFAAADRIFGELSLLTDQCDGILLNLESASMIDSGGISSLLKLIAQCKASNTKIYLGKMNRPVARALIKAKLHKSDTNYALFSTVYEARAAFMAT
jgi:SulP family sulfate permease